jgi:hypothetical protein
VDPADPDPQHCLAHDEASEDLVEGVLVIQRAEDEALQARLLHQDCVRQRLLALEGHRLSEKIFKLKHVIFNKKSRELSEVFRIAFTSYLLVLRIRDVYPRSEFFPSRI